jgi:predicted acyltransferase (DUF342 family)
MSTTGPTILGGTLAVAGATTLGDTLAVTGATILGGTLAVTGNVNLRTNLTVGVFNGPSTPAINIYKNATFSKPVNINTTLNVTSAATFVNTVRFNGAVSFANLPAVAKAKITGISNVFPDTNTFANSRLFVNNTGYFGSDLDVSGNTLIGGRLDVSGASMFANDVSFIGQRVDICGNFYAQYPADSIPQSAIIGGVGSNIFTTDVSMHANLAIRDMLAVDGKAKFAKDVSFNGQRVDICGNLYAQYPANSIPQTAIIGGVGSNIFTTDVSMHANLAIRDMLAVDGKAKFAKDVSFNGQRVDICGNLYAQYPANSIPQIAIIGGVGSDLFTTDVTMTKSLNVNQNATVSDQLTVKGDVSFNNSMKVNGQTNLRTLLVANKATFNADVDICGNLAANFAPGSISPTAINGGILSADTLTNDVTMTKSLNVNQNATVSDQLTVKGDVSFNNSMKVNGQTNLGTLSVANKATFNADVDICGNLAARFAEGSISPAAINGVALTANTLTNDVTMTKSLNVIQNATVSDQLTVKGDVSFNNSMKVNGQTNLGTLLVANKATFNADVDICGNLAARFAPGSISSTAISDGALSTREFINDVSMNKRLYVTQNATFNENAYINKDLTVRGRLMVEQYTDSAIIRTTTNEYVVIVTEDLSVNGNIVIENSAKINKLTVLNDISTNGLLNVNGLGKSVFLHDLDVGGILTANFANDSIPISAIPGLTGVVAKTNNAPNITEDISLNKRLFVNSDISSGGLLYVNGSVGDSRIKSNLTVDGFIVGQYNNNSIPINAVTGLNNAISNITNVNEDMTIGKRLFVTSDVSSGGLLYVNGAGTSTIAGDLTVNGVLRAKYNVNDISSSVIKGLDASLNKIPNVFEDISLNKRLFINSDISSGGLLQVNGLGTSVFLNGLDVRGILTANFADDSIPVRAIPGLTGVVAKTNTAPNITEDVSLNKRLFVNSDISSGGLLYVNGSVGDSRIKSNLTVDGFIVGQYNNNSIPINAVTGLNNAINSIPNLDADMTLGKRLFVTSDISSSGLLYINGTGNSKITSGLTVATLNADNITVSGNLTVNGTTTTLNTTNLGVKDSLIELSSGLTGGTNPVNDSGLLINRGNQNNVFMGWNETDKKFILGETTATGTSTGGLNVTVGTLVAKLNSDLVDINGGTIDNTSIGSSVASSGKFTSIETSSDVSMNSRLFVGGAVTLNDRVDICGNLYAKYPANSIPQTAIIGGVGSNSFSGDVLVEYKLTVTNDVSMNTKLSVGGDVSMNTKLTVGGDVSMKTKLLVDGDVSMKTKLLVDGDVSMNSRLYVKGETTLDGATIFTRDISVNGLSVGRGGGNVPSNSAFGKDALKNSTGENNTAIGYSASLNHITGSNNVSIGSQASQNGISGSDNIAIGSQSLFSNTGSKNIGIGTFVGLNHISGTENTLLGYYADVNGGPYNNSTAIGAYATITASNQIKLGTATETVNVPGSTNLVGDVSMNTKLAVGGDVSMNSKLAVGGDVSMNSKLAVGGDVSMNSKLVVGGEVTLKDRVDICGNLYAKYPANSIPQSAIIGGVGSNSFSGDVLVEYKLTVTNDVSMNTKLSVGGDVSMNSNLTVMGDVSLNSNLTVNDITVGRGAGSQINNTVVGNSALNSNTTGSTNTAIGWQALKSNTTGSSNVAIGTSALAANTTGDINNAFGASALAANTTGSANSAFGTHSQWSNSIGGSNTSIGYSSLYFNTSSYNTALGVDAGKNNRTSGSNTFLGYQTDISGITATWSNSTAVGAGAKITASNQITLGTATEKVYVPGTLSVIGATTLATLLVNNQLTVGGDISANNNLSVGNQITVGGDISASNNLSVGNQITAGFDISANNNLRVANTLSVGNQITVGGDISANNNLRLANNLIVGNKLTVSDDVSMNSKLLVGGDVSMNSRLFVGGNVSVYGARVDICGNLYAQYPNDSIPRSAIAGGVVSNSFTDDVVVDYKLSVTGDVSMNSKLSVGGDVSMNSKLYVKGQTILAGATSSTGDIIVNGRTLGRGPGNGNNYVFGFNSLDNNTSGQNNIAIGEGAIGSTFTANGNIGIGYLAGNHLAGGNNNTFLGYAADAIGGTHNNSTAIGANAEITASNQIKLGTASETVVVPGLVSVAGNITTQGNIIMNGGSLRTTDSNETVTIFDTATTINLGGASTNINIGTGVGNQTTVTIGANGDTVNILGNLNITGTTTTISAVNLDISDNAITLNKGGPTATFIGAGINFQENSDLSAGYIRVDADTARFVVRLPNLAGGTPQYIATKDNANDLSANNFTTNGNITMAGSGSLIMTGKYIKQF